MTTNTIERPRIVPRDEWLAARTELLAKKKEATRARDALNAEHRQLPIVEIEMDNVFHLLQNSRRRAVLRYLLDGGDEVYTIREIAEQVAAWETETPVARLAGTARQRVYIALYQCHLPKLAESDVIEYNRERGILIATPLVDVFAPYLDAEFHPDAVLTLDRD